MHLNINVPENENTEDKFFGADVFENGTEFPVLFLGRDSYIVGMTIDNPLHPEKDLGTLHNVQIGRYCSLADGVLCMIDMNHDYKRVAQGRISGIEYRKPHLTKRKGQIIIMNDCWIGANVTIMGGVTIGNGAVVAAGSVVTKDVPSYAVVGGNPARVIGYRFEKEEIEALNKIRWWNWKPDRVRAAGEDLSGQIGSFIDKHLKDAIEEQSRIPQIEIPPIEKPRKGKTYLYVPDFKLAYPTYRHVIDEFAKSKSGTNDELLLYVKQDELFDQKISILEQLFSEYDEYACFVNLFTDDVEDGRSLIRCADYYITNRSAENLWYMDMADCFGVNCISSVDTDIFNCNTSTMNRHD